ncbi:MAG: 50S ribosomal protein L4 [candidate division WOR-3 bacterium]|uniref:Large ribosomal subunit protein uL4 n=2 Tax=candidate division WOR-3 bacterium TaxID=2052148 RepID=A0A7V4CH78_UNCW3
MKAELLSINGEIKGEIEIPEEIFGCEVNQGLIWEAVTNYLNNQRQGTACTKTRGEVRGGGRKPWPQKHTGRARHGSIRSPIWRKGGIVFGPKPRDYYYSLPKKKKRLALLSALSARYQDKAVLFLENFTLEQPKTKLIYNILKNLKMNGENVLLVVKEMDQNIKLASRNIPNLTLMPANSLNAYEVLVNDKIVFTESGLEGLKELCLTQEK